MSGYRNAPEKTAEAFIDGDWLRTGDICAIDVDGFAYLTDRLKELIKYESILYVDPPQNVHTSWDLGFASWAFGLRPHMGPT